MEGEKKQVWIKQTGRRYLPWLLMFLLVLLYFAAAFCTHTPLVLLLNELFIALGYLAAWSDVREQKIPNRLILLILAVFVIAVLPQLVVSFTTAWPIVCRAGIGFAGAGGLMLIVYVVSKKGLGGGDVKFVAAAGCYLGLFNVLTALLIGSILAAVTGLVMIAAKRMKRTDSFPFVPYLYAGMVLILFLS